MKAGKEIYLLKFQSYYGNRLECKLLGCPQMLWADISAHRDQRWLWVAESDLRSASYILSVRKYLLSQGCSVSYICS